NTFFTITENMTRDTARNITMQQEEFTSFEIFVLCIFFATSVVGLVGNGLVIFLTGCRMKTTVNSIWFLNLAIADFIFLLAVIGYLVYVSVLDRWNSEFMIFILFMLLPLSLFTSIFFLVVISLDRCVSRIICIIVWVSSISCSRLFFRDITSLITYEFIVGFLITLLIIVTSYIAIGVRIKRLKMGKQLKSYHVIMNDQYIFKIVSIYLVCLNSCLNPVLYVFMCDEYKKTLKQSLLLVLETAFAEDHLDFKSWQLIILDILHGVNGPLHRMSELIYTK
uniref:G-protein coupled receptors family 1 profile domain-containing protein n=1 Tax=Sinocyclocheilus rhinocerous TaxID=307959 RepID=A0A673LRU2_9TELE